MKLITWNVNGIRAVERKKEIQKLVAEQPADFFLLQEIKGNKEQFSKFLTEHEDYLQFYHSAEKKGYAGTGIWVKKELADQLAQLTFKTTVPHLPNGDEGRIAHLAFVYRKKHYDILSIYFPNGGKSEQAWQDKLIFYDKVLRYMNQLRAKKHQVIVGGDVNVAHTEIDLARPKENDGRIGFHPQERAWMDELIGNDWADVWRSKHPGKKEVYSYWDLKTRARERNVGWRIDYFFADKKFLTKVQKIFFLSEQMGSDHCPLVMEFKS